MGELSFIVRNPQEETKNRIFELKNKSLFREKMYTHQYAIAFMSDDSKNSNTFLNKIAVEKGYQKAMSELENMVIRTVAV